MAVHASRSIAPKRCEGCFAFLSAGYYGVSSFVIANTLSSVPFIFVIALLSSCTLYFIAGLNTGGDRFPYFVLDLFLSLVTVRPLRS